jgi:hypothetical protein
MSTKDATPPRGEDAWKAEKKRIADRNEAAFARAREARAAHDAVERNRRLAEERREFANLPRQPAAPRPTDG